MNATPKKTSPKSKAANTQTSPHPKTKPAQIIKLLNRKNGASLAELIILTGWQAHSVRGYLSGTIKRKRGLKLVSTLNDQGLRRYSLKGSSRK